MNRTTAHARSIQFSLKHLLGLFAIVSAVLGAVVVFGLRGVTGAMLVFSIWTIYYGAHRRSAWPLIAGIVFTCASGLGLYVATVIHVEFGGVGPIRSSVDYPFELTDMIKLTGADPERALAYDHGGFIDSEYAWRIDLTPTQRDQVVAELGLMPVATGSIPQEFYQAFPGGWRPQNTSDSQYFGTPGFPTNQRGPDGQHYLVMYDVKRGQLYVWLKRNF